MSGVSPRRGFAGSSAAVTSPNPELWARLKDLFRSAIALDGDERGAFLASIAGEDADLGKQLRELVEAHGAGGAHLASPLDRAAPGLPLWIGSYRIVRLIAAGGMGRVYEAEQEQPRRQVAVKVLRRELASRAALRRFELEAELLARLRHPAVAQIFEAGVHDDGTGPVPYFAMEYIPGARPITRYAEEEKLKTRQRLELFAGLCDAVHDGHQKGIIHRDLKPSNILVDPHGRLKVIDFGVARVTDADRAATTLHTEVGQLIGTLQYMSPEQC